MIVVEWFGDRGKRQGTQCPSLGDKQNSDTRYRAQLCRSKEQTIIRHFSKLKAHEAHSNTTYITGIWVCLSAYVEHIRAGTTMVGARRRDMREQQCVCWGPSEGADILYLVVLQSCLFFHLIVHTCFMYFSLAFHNKKYFKNTNEWLPIWELLPWINIWAWRWAFSGHSEA